MIEKDLPSDDDDRSMGDTSGRSSEFHYESRTSNTLNKLNSQTQDKIIFTLECNICLPISNIIMIL